MENKYVWLTGAVSFGVMVTLILIFGIMARCTVDVARADRAAADCVASGGQWYSATGAGDVAHCDERKGTAK